MAYINEYGADMKTNRIKLTSEVKYRLLKEITFKMRDSFDLDTTLRHILSSLNKIIHYDAAGIFILNNTSIIKQGTNREQIIAGIARVGYDDSIPVETDDMLMQGKGIIGHVIKTGKAVVVENVKNDPDYIEARTGTLSEIAVPIIKNGQTIGALNLESDTVSAYNNDDIRTLNFFAGIAGITIEKELLHNQLVRSKVFENQLRVAKEIQGRLFPKEFPLFENYEIAANCISTFGIGGDYYDYIKLNENKYAIIVVDISGHGIPAALIMTAFRALIRSHAVYNLTPAELMSLINRQISEFTRKNDFISAFYGILDVEENTFIYTNCGHNPAILFRNETDYIMLNKCGAALNLKSDSLYTNETIEFLPGNQLLIYTDGVVETFSRKMEEFGLARLTGTFSRNYKLSPEKIIDQIFIETRNFHESDFFDDDFTLLIIKKKLLNGSTDL